MALRLCVRFHSDSPPLAINTVLDEDQFMVHVTSQTIPEYLAATVARCSDQPALGTIVDGQLTWRTWREVADAVQRCAAAFQQHGICEGDRVAQWATNSFAWIVVDLALLELGAVHVPLHASLAIKQVRELLELADAKLLVVEKCETDFFARGSTLPVLRHQELLEQKIPAQNLLLPVKNSSPSELATLLFTSGTTGQPRGVMLSQENLTANAIATAEHVGAQANETRLCFLPLSHIYARTCDLYSWIIRGTRLVLAESRETIVRDCQLCSPDVINAVPYFYQKIAQQLQATKPGTLQQLLGGKLRRCSCGGAAVAPETEALFERQGLPILSGYGLTEASPVVSSTACANYHAGSVGRPLPNLEVKISPEGEIHVRGPSVMLGYWQDPKATANTIVDGWLHTGDLGKFDSKGNLHIVGRQKDLIVLSTGKNIAPTRVEQRLLSSPLIKQVCVVGDGRKCLGALIVPNSNLLQQQAVTDPQLHEQFHPEIERLLSDLSAQEQIGRLSLVNRDFSVEQGELTAKLSMRRATIAKNFANEIEAMFAE